MPNVNLHNLWFVQDNLRTPSWFNSKINTYMYHPKDVWKFIEFGSNPAIKMVAIFDFLMGQVHKK